MRRPPTTRSARPVLIQLEGRTTPATFTVDTLSDVTAADGQTTLREAVALADANPGADTIAFAPALAGGTITLGAAGDGLSLSGDITISGFPANPITVAGAFTGAAPIDIFAVQPGVTAAISGLRISNATPNGHGVLNLGTLALDRVTITGVTGGSGFLNAGMATVTNSVISGNTTAVLFEGGGVTNAAGATLTVRDTRIENNRSNEPTVGAGGGLAALGGRVDLFNVTIANNTAAVGGGGVLVSGGTFTADAGTAITGNVATVGGGLLALGLPPFGTVSRVPTVTLTGVTIDGNVAGSGGGVAVAAFDTPFAPTVTLAGVAVTNNKADADSTDTIVLVATPTGVATAPRGVGGGLAIAGGTVTVSGGRFTGNVATLGGGVGVVIGSVAADALTISNNSAVSGAGAGVLESTAGTATAAFAATTFDGNTAGRNQTGSLTYTLPGITTPAVLRGAGGGLYAAGTVTATNVTLVNNAATTGGGVAAGGGATQVLNATVAGNAATVEGGGVAVGAGVLTARSSILAANTAALNPDTAGAVTSAGGNVVGVVGTATGFVSSDRTGTATLPLDPRLGPLADNGGPTRTRLPAANSPAVDRGTTSATPTTDQRGRPRVVGTAVDAGAVERQADDPTSGTRFALSRTLAVGPDAGTAAAVRVFNPDGTPRFSVTPFGEGFTNGIRVATADLTGDGIEDLVVGTGPGIVTRVQVIDGQTRAVAFDLSPFESTFTGGVYVAVGDLDADCVADLVITPDEGGGPRVDVYGGKTFGKRNNFFGIDDVNFRGGARASVADVTGDGTGDLIVVAGFGGGPRVAGFEGTSLAGTPRKIFADFFAFELTLRNGVFITAGDLNGDGSADVIVGGGPGGGPRVLAFDGKGLLADKSVPLANFFGGDANNRGGIRLAAKDLDADTIADLVTGSGTGAGSHVTAYLGPTISNGGMPPSTLDFDAFEGVATGVFVG